MDRRTVGAYLAAPALVAGALAYPAAYPAAHHNLSSPADPVLTSEALVMIPAANEQWLEVAKEVYLVPSGFAKDGTTTFVQVPETSDLNASISGTESILLNAIESRWHGGGFTAADPLYVFGYSQAAVAAGMIEQQLHNDGIPSNTLHFVLVGDSAAGDGGGFLNQFMPTLLQYVPAAWQPATVELVDNVMTGLRVDSVIGAATPNDLYPTDVYTLTGDGFADWDGGRNVAGMFWEHLAYLGLTPAEIDDATPETIEQTVYHTIDSADVNMIAALANSLEVVLSALF